MPPRTSDIDFTIVPDRAFWVGAGLGLGSAGLAAAVDLSYWTRARLLRTRAALHADFAGGADPDRSTSVSEVAVLVGQGRPALWRNWGAAAIGVGVAFVGSVPEPARATIGVALESQLISGITPHVALTAAANVNPVHSYASLTASLLIGRMPWRPPVVLRDAQPRAR